LWQNWIDAHGGSSGGWDERDHALFVRLRQHTAGNVRQLTQRAVAEIPEQTADSVAKHIQVGSRCPLCVAARSVRCFGRALAMRGRPCLFVVVLIDLTFLAIWSQWYDEYLVKLEEKKRLVREWKTAKQARSRRVLDSGSR
jgi:hypothetical protein